MGITSLVCLLALSGAVDDNRAFQEGVNLYQALEFEQAIFRFEEAALAPELTDVERGLVFSWMAMAYAGIGDVAGSKRSLRNALLKDADVVLPGFAPPKVRGWLEDERRAIQAERGPKKGLSSAPETTSSPSKDPATESPATDESAPKKDESATKRPEPGEGSEGAPRDDTKDRAATDDTETWTVEPEQPGDEGGAVGSVLAFTGIGVGVVAGLLGAVLVVPSAAFFIDYYVITQVYVPQIQAQLDDGSLSPSDRAARQEQLVAYNDASTLDLVGAIGFLAPAVILLVVGISLAAVGTGYAVFSE